MKIIQNKLRFGIALILLTILCGCSQPKTLVYQDINGFRVHNVDLQQATVVIELRFFNPNNYALNLKKGNVDAYFNDKYVGKAFVDETIVVPAAHDFVMPVTITAPLTSIVTNVLAILNNNDVKVRLDGSVNVGKDGIFIKVPVHYEGMQKIVL